MPRKESHFITQFTCLSCHLDDVASCPAVQRLPSPLPSKASTEAPSSSQAPASSSPQAKPKTQPGCLVTIHHSSVVIPTYTFARFINTCLPFHHLQPLHYKIDTPTKLHQISRNNTFKMSASSTINVKNIAPATSDSEIKDFFSFW